VFNVGFVEIGSVKLYELPPRRLEVTLINKSNFSEEGVVLLKAKVNNVVISTYELTINLKPGEIKKYYIFKSSFVEDIFNALMNGKQVILELAGSNSVSVSFVISQSRLKYVIAWQSPNKYINTINDVRFIFRSPFDGNCKLYIDGHTYLKTVSANKYFEWVLDLSDQEEHPFLVECIGDNNEYAKLKETIIYDKTPPSINIIQTPNTNSGDLVFKVSDNVATKILCKIYLDSIEIQSLYCDNSEECKIFISKIPNGTHNLKIQCFDWLDNNNYVELPLNINGDITLNSPEDNYVTTNTTITFSWSTLNNNCILHVDKDYNVSGTTSKTLTLDYGIYHWYLKCGDEISEVRTLAIIRKKDFNYYKPIIITSPYTISDYQIKIVINTLDLITQGKLKSDCRDIRFTLPDGTEIPYYLENCNSTSTIIWIKVPKIQKDINNVIIMWYGNSLVDSNSNPYAVFIYYNPGNILDFDYYPHEYDPLTGSWGITYDQCPQTWKVDNNVLDINIACRGHNLAIKNIQISNAAMSFDFNIKTLKYVTEIRNNFEISRIWRSC
jgi:hypothetical protein